MVELTPTNILMKHNNKQKTLWQQIIKNTLNKDGNYECISAEDMVGCFLGVYVKDELKRKVTSVEN